MISVYRNANEFCTGEMQLNFCSVAEIIFASISKLTSTFLIVCVCLFFGFSFELDFTAYWFPQLMSSIKSLRRVHSAFIWQS